MINGHLTSAWGETMQKLYCFVKKKKRKPCVNTLMARTPILSYKEARQSIGNGKLEFQIEIEIASVIFFISLSDLYMGRT